MLETQRDRKKECSQQTKQILEKEPEQKLIKELNVQNKDIELEIAY